MVVKDRRLVQRCEYTVPQHVCQEGCYWINNPVDAEMTSRVVILTPDIAKGWLRHNTLNRKFSRNGARSLSTEMARGYWRENGESIVFDREGILIDGQHRLQAVLNSGHSYRCPVITGIEAVVRPTVDTGLKRSGAANLQMAGEPNATALAATLLLWKGYQARDARVMTHPQSGPPETRTSIPGIMDYLSEYPGIRQAVSETLSLRPAGQGRALVPSSEAALVWYAIVDSGAGKDRASEFVGSVLSGYNLNEQSPIVALRRRLIDHLRPGQRMDKRERIALLLKTWQLWSTGKTRKVLRWEADEGFPFLAGLAVRQ